MLLHLLQEFNGFNYLQGGMLFDAQENLLSQDMKMIKDHLENSTLEDALLLVSPDEDLFYKRVVVLSWIAVQIEKELKMYLENQPTEMNATLRSLLFGETTIKDLESKIFASSEEREYEIEYEDEDEEYEDEDEEECLNII